MTDITYTFYVEINAVAITGLTPTIEKMISISDGSLITPVPTISEISDGFYKFTYSWDDSSVSPGFLLKIDTGANTDVGRIITMRIEPQDYLPNVVNTLKTSSDSLSTSVSSLETSVDTIDSYSKRLLDIEQGTWQIEGTQLVMYGAGYGSNSSTVIARYDLEDANGIPTATNPFRRIINSITAI